LDDTPVGNAGTEQYDGEEPICVFDVGVLTKYVHTATSCLD